MSDSLTARQHKAALLVSDDELTNEEIAADCGIDPRTLTRWKLTPDFAATVQQHIERLAHELSKYRIARKDKRVAAYQDRWERIGRLIEARGEALADEVAGGETGFVSKEIEIGRDGTVIENYKSDTGLMAALLNLEKQAATEAGQWSEKRELTGKDGAPLFDLDRLVRVEYVIPDAD